MLLCVFFLLYLPPRFTVVSVVFDFNTPLKDAAPVSLIMLPVVVKIKNK